MSLQNKIDFKVCILTAGKGSRLGKYTSGLNKALLPVGEKAAITRIIEKFCLNTELVIAVGHLKEQVVSYLHHAHPERNITFVDVDNFSGPGSGPGYSLYRCKDFLQCPFIFFSSDTIVIEEIEPPTFNWMGCSLTDNAGNFCTFDLSADQYVEKIVDKIPYDTAREAFIGVAGINDYKSFWNGIVDRLDLVADGEVQVSNGFVNLIDKRIKAIRYTWLDTGTVEGWRYCCKVFGVAENQFDFSKDDEWIYFVNNRVIKFFRDIKISEFRFKRSLNMAVVPELTYDGHNFYSYERIHGSVLYDALEQFSMDELFRFLREKLWLPTGGDCLDLDQFASDCQFMYMEKPKSRIARYESYNPENKNIFKFDETELFSTEEIFDAIKLNDYAMGVPVEFHGDLQFDNILLTDNGFVLLDWRDKFGTSLTTGDLYYDLGKLYGGILVSYRAIKRNGFSFEKSLDDRLVSLTMRSDPGLSVMLSDYEKLLELNEFDVASVRISTGLIFLSMAPMHKPPFNHFIYFLGRYLLTVSLTGKQMQIPWLD